MKIKSVFMIALILFSSLTTLLVFSSDNNTISASVLYVGTGSKYQTIQDAVDNAISGDTIIVKNGTYMGSININTPNIEIIGNSSEACRIIYQYNGTNYLTDFAAGFNVSAGGVIISGFNVTVSGNYSYGFRLIGSQSNNSRISGNNIKTTGNFGFGIFSNESSEIEILNNHIVTTGPNGYGIFIQKNSDSRIESSTVYTSGNGASGIICSLSYGTTITNCEIELSNTNSMGLKVDGLDAEIRDSIIDSTNDFDIYVTADGNVTSVNCTFNNVDLTSDGGGVLQVKNYLTVLVLMEDAKTPISGCDLAVIDNGLSQYSSEGFNGSQAKTNPEGKVEKIIVTSSWFYYENTRTMNTTDIKVKIKLDSKWEESRFGIDMNTSHTEVFIATDITAPEIPANLSLMQISGKNEINISWSFNSDDAKTYSVYSNRSGPWNLIKNESINNYFIDNFSFIHSIDYYYKISAWDEVPIQSELSPPKSIRFIDNIRPKTPGGLSVTPIVKGDSLNISWFPNNDDTMTYSVYTNRTGSWELIQNVTHPKTYYHANGDLVHGKRYYFKISAWDEVPQESPLSAAVSAVHEDQVKPDAPKGLKAVSQKGNLIQLSWDANLENDIEGYMVFMNITDAGSGGPYINITTVDSSTTEFPVTNLTEEIMYYFVVLAFDEVPLFSDYSNEAGNITFDATAPSAPVLSHLPEYTNVTELVVHGQSEPNTTVKVLRNNNEAGISVSGPDGEFSIMISLKEGSNDITAFAIDKNNNAGQYSAVQTVVLDTVLPFADAGRNIFQSVGLPVLFNASSSYDQHTGIINYTWRFDYNNKTTKLFGVYAGYTFDKQDRIQVVLRVFDFAGNWNEDIITVTIVEGPVDRTSPKILTDGLFPPINGKDIPVRLTVVIPLDEKVNATRAKINLSGEIKQSTRTEYDIVPGIVDYDEANTTLNYVLTRDLQYNQTYTVNITLEDLFENVLEFSWSFTTTEKPQTPPDTKPPEVNQTGFFKYNNRLPINGQVIIPFTESLNASTISVTVYDDDGEEVKGDMAYDEETYTVVFTPDKPLKYDSEYVVKIYVEDTAGNPIPENANEFTFITEKEEELGMLSPFVLWAMIFVIVIVVILIVVMLVITRRAEKPEDAGDEALEEE